jgi:hypothetical protein
MQEVRRSGDKELGSGMQEFRSSGDKEMGKR